MKSGYVKSVKSRLTRSPPSRGAWIEILSSSTCSMTAAVAPLAGGVD